MSEAIRNSEKSALLLDCGEIFPEKPDKDADLSMKITFEAMKRMKYDVMNIGSRDLLIGKDLLHNMAINASVPLISSNLAYYNDINPSWYKKYIIKKTGKIKIAILGIMSSKNMPIINKPDSMNIVSPSDALKKLIPEIKKQANSLILLSQANINETSSMIQDIADKFDLIILSDKKFSDIPQKIGTTPVLTVEPQGKSLGHVRISIAPDGKITIMKNELIKLDETVPSDDEFVKFIDERITQDARDKRREQLEKMHKELQKDLTLSPQEFLKQYNQETVVPKK